MMKRIQMEVAQLKTRGALKGFAPTTPLKPPEVEHKGSHLIDFSCWDYCGLSTNARLRKLAQRGLEHQGFSAPSPRLSGGSRNEHAQLESRLSRFLGTQSSCLFSSRTVALFSLLTSLLRDIDTVVVDELYQGPVAEVAELIGAKCVVVNSLKGNLLEILESEASLSRAKGSGEVLLVLEALSPVTGTVQCVENILEKCVSFGVSIVLDEAYSLGCAGIRGSVSGGLAPSSLPSILAIVGSFGLGVPGIGGFIAGGTETLQLVISQSFSLASEPAMPPAFAALTEASFDEVELAVGARTRISDFAKQIRETAFGTSPLSFKESPVVCLPFAKPSMAESFILSMKQRGILVDRVPRGTLRDEVTHVRIIVTAHHKEGHIEKLNRAIFENSHAITEL